MYGKVKITKRQIKEDKFTTFMLNLKHQFLENWQFYVIGLVVIILIIIAGVYYANSQKVKAVEAANNFSRAFLDYRSGNAQVAILSLNQIIEDYPDNQVAEQATFLLGKINFDSKNYPEAIRYFEMYLSKYKDNKLNRAAALAGIAASMENQTNYLEAAQKYNEAYNEYTEGPMVGDYQLGAMRNYLDAGDISSAQVNLEYLKKEFAGTDLEKRAVRYFTEKSLTK